jgi:tryptophan-rich sensory protein
MNQTGWEIRPIGWVILIALVGIAGYFLYKQIETSNKWLSG